MAKQHMKRCSASLPIYWAFLLAQTVKNLSAMRESWVWSLGWEDLLEKGMATHSSILAWRIPWIEELESYSPRGYKESGTTEPLTHSHLLNVNPNHNEISSHTSQNNYCQKKNKQWMLVRMWRKGNPATMGANVSWCSHYANQYEVSSENWN